MHGVLMPSIRGAGAFDGAPPTTNIAEEETFTGEQLGVSDASAAGSIQVIIAKWRATDEVTREAAASARDGGDAVAICSTTLRASASC